MNISNNAWELYANQKYSLKLQVDCFASLAVTEGDGFWGEFTKVNSPQKPKKIE